MRFEYEQPEERSWHDAAQICLNGHIINASSIDSPQFNHDFCEKCGAKAITECPSCSKPIKGRYHSPGFFDLSPLPVPAYCGHCGKPFPWTEAALAAAKEYTDELDVLTIEEKARLTASIADLTSDTSRTPLAVSRVRKFLEKIGKPAAQGLMQITVSVLTEEAKRQLGLKP